MNTRQKKKHSYLFSFIKGIEPYKRHVFCVKKKALRNVMKPNARKRRKWYKEGEYIQKYNFSVFTNLYR